MNDPGERFVDHETTMRVDGPSCKLAIVRFDHHHDVHDEPDRVLSAHLYSRDGTRDQLHLLLKGAERGEGGSRQLWRSVSVEPPTGRDSMLMVDLLPDGSVRVSVNVSNTAEGRYVRFPIQHLIDSVRIAEAKETGDQPG